MTAADWMKETYRREYERNPVFTLFLTMLIVFFVVFVIAAIVTGGSSAYRAMYWNHEDMFMDHFNSIMYSFDRPYTHWRVIYPPLVTVYYAVLGHFTIPFADAAHDPMLSFALRDTQAGMLSFFIVVILTLYVLYLVFSKFVKEEGHRKEILFLFTVLLAYPFLYAVERGNSIILALVFCFLFLMGYRSENKVVRYASYFALGCAAGIKLYPVILGLLILRERRYMEAAICISIVAAVVLIPFVFTDGDPIILLDTLFRYTGSPDTYGFTNFNQLIFGVGRDLLGAPSGIVQAVSYAVIGTFTLLSFIVILFDKEMKSWKVLALLGCNLILGLGVGGAYQMIYMIPAVLCFLNSEKEMTKENKFYVVCFAMIFVLIPGIAPGWVNPSPIIGSIEAAFVIIIAVALLREGIGRLRRRADERRSGAPVMETDNMGT